MNTVHYTVIKKVKGEFTMKYINEQDYEYIMNKYHDTSKPFDGNARFVRRDEIFSPDTGMDGNAIIEEILHQDAELSSLPHPIRKAKAFELVLKKTRISCDSRDRFPAINMIDRPLNQTLIKQWRNEVFGEIIPEVESKRAYFERSGIATIWPDFDHSVPDWDRLFDLGFCGILNESEKRRVEKSELNEEQAAFYDGIRITYTAIINFIDRLEKQAVSDGNIRMSKALASIKENAPQSFYEALLFDYVYFMLSEHIEGLQVRSLCNFDRLFYRFYKSDTKNGVTEENIRSDLAYFFLQFTAIGNYWNQPVYLGGCKEDESTEINELSYIFLDVYDKMGIYNPKIQIKIADSTPKEFILKALDMIRRGKNSIVFVCDATIRRAIENAGFTPEQARLCDIKGCYEYSVRGSYGSAGMCYINLLKPLEYALHEGCDGVSGEFARSKPPRAEDYETFEDFYAEYKRQLGIIIDEVIDVVNSFEIYLPQVNPLSMLSATLSSCLERNKDALGGGAAANGNNMMFGFLADAVDSLTNVKKYVFDKKALQLGELRDILDSDFNSNEQLRRQLRADRDKYGNNKDLPDSIARDIAQFVCSKVCGRPNSPQRGGKWNLGFHVARQIFTQAPKTAAAPNGRLRGEELSKNLSASVGMNREGATAAILSITKIDATAFTSDACLDLGLLPSSVRGDDGLEAMYGLLCTFCRRGGHALHFNVFDAETLRDAQKNPGKYSDLQIRVSGWNVLWNNLCREEQESYIRQAESLI